MLAVCESTVALSASYAPTALSTSCLAMASFHQSQVAIHGDFGQLQVGLRGGQLGFGLIKLLIDLRRFDLGQQLSGFHARADIGVPFLQITAGARVHRRIDERLNVAGQRDFFLQSPRLGWITETDGIACSSVLSLNRGRGV